MAISSDLSIGCRGTWRTFDGTTGLPGPAIALFEDRTGYLWFGTWGYGAGRYDGEVFDSLTSHDGLASDVVWSILQDAEGAMWFGTDTGLSRYDGTCFTNYTSADGLVGDDVNTLYLDREGRLWIGTVGGLSLLDGRAFASHPAVEGLCGGQVHAIAEDGEGGLWFGTDRGLVHYEEGRGLSVIELEGGPGHGEVCSLRYSSEGKLWVGTETGSLCFDGERFVDHAAADGVSTQVRDMIEDRQGRMWFATREGVQCCDGDRSTRLTHEDGLINNQVIALAQDRAGDFWFGTFAGMSQYSQSFTSFTSADGLANDDLRAIVRDSRGTLWLATLGGLSCFDGERFTSFTSADGLAHDRVFDVVEDEAGDLWIGTEQGLNRYDGEEFETFTTQDGLVHNRVYDICRDRQGALWLGTEEGISRYDGREFVNFTTQEGLVGDDVNQIIVDRLGRLWIATETGVSCYDGERFVNYTPNDGLVGEHAMGLAEDGDGRIWVAALGGVSCFDGERFTNYGLEDGLTNEGVMRVFVDSMGYLWFATWGGLDRFDGTVFQSINRYDGLAGTIAMAFYEDCDGGFWLGTGGGVTHLHLPEPSPPPVFIRAVVADRRYEDLEEVRFPASVGLAAFEFHSINYKTRPGAMVYRYRLEGRDQDWQTTHERRVEYQDLPPGDYVFQVTAVDRDLNYSMPARVEIGVTADTRDEKIDELEARVRERTRELQGKNTALEETLAQLQEAQNRLIMQEKMATVGNLVAGILHELNSPLGAVNSAADVLGRGLERIRDMVAEQGSPLDIGGNPRLNQVLELLETNNAITETAIERIGRMVDSLKSFTSLDQAEFQQADVHAGLESALTLLEHELGDRIAVEKEYGELPRIGCHPRELNQVFMNVLMNAVQAMEGEGKLGIRTLRDGASIQVQVRDTGRGIAAERLGRIFDPSISRKGDRVGMGLGLATSLNIVRQHRGDLRIESQPGEGTLVTIVLPIDPA